MKDILVILTGGTIGSCIKNGSIDIDNSSKCMVVEKYKELYEKGLKCTKPNHTAQNNDSDTDVTDRFEVRESFSILSENSTVSYLNALLTEVANIDQSKYNGIIITHGSDTIPYTSALLGSVLKGRLEIPLVVVGTMLPLGVPGSDGVYNFASGVGIIDTFICNKNSDNKEFAEMLRDVFVVDGGDIYGSVVHRGVEVTEADTLNDVYGIYGDEEFGFLYFNKTNVMFLDGDNPMEWMDNTYFGNEDFYLELNSDHVNTCEPNVSEEIFEQVFKGEKKLGDNVLYLKQVPGFNYDCINISNLKAVLLYGYHCGTFCVEGDGTDLSKFIKRCNEANVTVYLASSKHEKAGEYGSTTKLKSTEFIQLYDLSPEAAYVNVLLNEAE